jgi:quinol monooxygenase YgiN
MMPVISSAAFVCVAVVGNGSLPASWIPCWFRPELTVGPGGAHREALVRPQGLASLGHDVGQSHAHAGSERNHGKYESCCRLRDEFHIRIFEAADPAIDELPGALVVDGRSMKKWRRGGPASNQVIIAEYRMRKSGVEKVKRAIEEFVPHVKANEPGTRRYLAWLLQDEPTRFLHLFIFENEAAHDAHSQSEAVKQFERAYRPELAGGVVVFADYRLVASKLG